VIKDLFSPLLSFLFIDLCYILVSDDVCVVSVVWGPILQTVVITIAGNVVIGQL